MNNQNEIIVESWCDLQEIVFKDWWNPRIKRYRAPHAFRGMANKDSPLSTSLMRLGGPYVKIEPHLLRNFRRYAGTQDPNFNSIWHWIALGQHHGLPTRLLDWTYSPFVALHFVTCDYHDFDKDGVIWVVDFFKSQKMLPQFLKGEMDRDDVYIFNIELLSKVLPGDYEALKNLKKDSENDFVLFLEPPSINDRFVNQFALFSLMSDPTLAMDEWLKAQTEPGLWKKIIIPKELKGEVRDKLDQSNITERVLFPGLDGIAKWLTRHYSPQYSYPPK